MTKTAPVSIIIVTYNSQKHIGKAVECLQKQTHLPQQVILVDTGSNDLSYLEPYRHLPGYQLIQAEKNSGFCRGNNVGMRAVDPSIPYVLFLNPDAFLTPRFLEEAVAFMAQQPSCGALTGTLLGYDIDENSPTGKYDTTGIFQKWYGHWYDRDQGNSYEPGRWTSPETIPAICGALFFARRKALDSALVGDQEVFDSSFYMYKEDIDLSLRLRKKGWQLFFVPALLAYHCRGWNPDRSKMARKMRLSSAWNELRIHTRQVQPIPTAYSLAKYATVKLFDL